MNAPSNFEGHLDSLSASGLIGWAAEGFDPAQVFIEINGERSGLCNGGLHRADLIPLGRSPSSGFVFTFATPLKAGDIVSVFSKQGQHLVNSPKIFTESPGQTMAERPFESERNCIFFLHIPKTAGTSLRSQLQAHASDVAFIYNDEFSDPIMLQAYRSRPLPKLFFGHFSYGVHRIISASPRYACVLRNPIDRIVSLYAHQFFSGKTGACRLPFGNAGLRSFVRESLDVQTNNHMCRIISGIADDHMTLKDTWLLDCALHNLQSHFELTVSCDRLDIASSYLKSAIGEDVGIPQRENISRMPEFKIDLGTIEVIQEFNALDIALYDRISTDPIKVEKFEEGVW